MTIVYVCLRRSVGLRNKINIFIILVQSIIQMSVISHCCVLGVRPPWGDDCG